MTEITLVNDQTKDFPEMFPVEMCTTQVTCKNDLSISIYIEH